ncbi:endolytic transglycosylase MltG [Candidatus Dojkabacteria bacterium]|uniref:Endolytic murein transglycosylase n=1 Tax=Candidatus Dojkabacteria bacterium TaxID=2099670 RepID=A0A955KUV6_9BACT|nr:endolytic transglycosylase MltG [Candidatus Dojkabacteria bacterium]MCB9790845.1 endolytic transglycosylase MltG [Candidatus Nomurabacteria bacterium]
MKAIKPTVSPKRKIPKANPIKKIGFAAISVVLMLIFGISVYYSNAIKNPNSTSSEEIQFTIEEGETVQEVAEKLVNLGLLKDSRKSAFLIYTKQTDQASKIQAGVFRLPKNLNIEELAIELQKAGVPDLWVTIPEGLRIDEVGRILQTEFNKYDESVFDKARFLGLTTDKNFIQSLGITDTDTLEGYLFPNRYLLPIQSTEELVINQMVTAFSDSVDEISYHDLIIASMVEREGRNDEERRMIADIISRREKEGWFLNIDATLLYFYKDWSKELTERDINQDQPYNTYTRTGLPPTPICNPGLSSINAVLDPVPNSYYYYIHDASGNIHYATTEQEHYQNVQNYLLR